MGRGPSTEGYRYARVTVFIMFVTAMDIFNFFDRGGSKKYLILAVPVIVVLYDWTRLRTPYVRTTTVTDKIFLAILLMGLAGSLYASMIQGSGTSARVVFLPLSLAILYLLVLRSPTDDECKRILLAITLVGALYLLVAALVNSGVLPDLAKYKQFRNAQFTFVMFGIAGAIVARRRWLLVALCGLEAANFAAYPSATSILCVIATIVTFSVTKPRASRARPYVFASIALLATLFALAHVSRVEEVTGDYFVAVGKSNASSVRVAIWSSGIEDWKTSPFFGNAFTGGTVAQTIRSRNGTVIQLPFHNDYVLFLREGGLVGLGLLLAFILTLNITLTRAHRNFVAQARDTRAGLVRLLLVGFNCFFVAAAFNPVLEGMSRSAVIGMTYGLAMLVVRDGRTSGEEGEDADDRETQEPGRGVSTTPPALAGGSVRW